MDTCNICRHMQNVIRFGSGRSRNTIDKRVGCAPLASGSARSFASLVDLKSHATLPLLMHSHINRYALPPSTVAVDWGNTCIGRVAVSAPRPSLWTITITLSLIGTADRHLIVIVIVIIIVTSTTTIIRIAVSQCNKHRLKNNRVLAAAAAFASAYC